MAATEAGGGKRPGEPAPASPVRAALAAAACALVGASARAAIPVSSIESGVLFYRESDRVTAVESVVRISRPVGEERFLRLKLVWDALTGASANGATPSRAVQTFTRPSGKGSYRIAPGATPLDDTFRDSRLAGSLGYERPLGRLSRASVGANLSTEHDYASYGLSAVLSRDFDRRNRTLTLGISGALDRVNPEGGPPVPFEEMRPAGEPQPKQGGTRDKKVYDLLAGVTQVISPSALVQLNYSVSRSSGYLTDPYKIVSVVEPDPGPGQGEPLRYLYEKRPDSRLKQSLFAEGKLTTGLDVIGLSYRFHWDDWGVRSHTLEGRYRWQATERTYLEPQVRWYRQSEADFYRTSLPDGTALPAHASADYRLGLMDTVTGGLKVGRFLGRGHEVSFRIESYSQSGDGHPAGAIGVQRDYDLFPTVRALVAQFGYTWSL